MASPSPRPHRLAFWLAPLILACCMGSSRVAPLADESSSLAPAPAPSPVLSREPAVELVPPAPPVSSAPPAPLFLGRFDFSEPAGPRFSWSGSAIVARFTGPRVAITLEDNGWNWFEVEIDGQKRPPLGAKHGVHEYILAGDLADGEHVLRFARRNEAHGGVTRFVGLSFADGHGMLAPPPRPTRRIEYVGDSITCGFGTEGTHPCPFEYRSENHELTYAAIAARELGAEAHTICWSGWGIVRGADGGWGANVPSVYGRTLHKRAQPAWEPAAFHPDAVVIALGTNDFGIGDPGKDFVEAYVLFLARLRALHPDALVVATTSPMLRDAQKAKQRELIEVAIARSRQQRDQKLVMLDFPSQRTEAMGCGNHPGRATHADMASRLVATLREQLGW